MAAVGAVNSKNASSILSPMREDPERLVSIQFAADFLCVSDVTIRRYLGAKKLRRFKLSGAMGKGGRTLVKLGDLMKLVEEVK